MSIILRVTEYDVLAEVDGLLRVRLVPLLMMEQRAVLTSKSIVQPSVE